MKIADDKKIDAVERRKKTILERQIRIESGNPSDSDLLFLERRRERQLATQEKNLNLQKAKQRERDERRRKKLEQIEITRKQKSIMRTPGVVMREQTSRPFCKNCAVSLTKQNGVSKLGYKKWHKYCNTCASLMYNKSRGYLLQKKNRCETCDFIPSDMCQLDLVYLDGDSKNRNSKNLKTLCANCSRLHSKKLREKDRSIFDITIDSDVRI